MADLNPTSVNRLAEGETLDGGGATVTVPAIDDDEAAPSALLELPDGATVRNLTLVGPVAAHTASGGAWDYPDSASAWDGAASAIKVVGSNVTVENVTCRGWTHAGVAVGEVGGADHSRVTVLDCDLVDNNARGLGYGVVIYSGEALVEKCYLDNNRHDIAGSGEDGVAYTARYNHVGDAGRLYGFEMHDPGGEWVNIHHNTFEDKRQGSGGRASLIVNRGVPSERCRVTDNWFKGELTTSLAPGAADRYTFGNNHEGGGQPPGVGADAEPKPQPGTIEYDLVELRAALSDLVSALVSVGRATARLD